MQLRSGRRSIQLGEMEPKAPRTLRRPSKPQMALWNTERLDGYTTIITLGHWCFRALVDKPVHFGQSLALASGRNLPWARVCVFRWHRALCVACPCTVARPARPTQRLYCPRALNLEWKWAAAVGPWRCMAVVISGWPASPSAWSASSVVPEGQARYLVHLDDMSSS